MSKKRFSNRLPKLQRSTRPRWLRAVSKLLASHSPELVIDSTRQEVAEIAAVVVEAIVEAAAEAVLPELMSREIRSLMPLRKRVADSRVSQEVIILSTSSLVLVEARENLTRRRVAMVVATGAQSQIVPTREVKSMRACQKVQFQPRLLEPRPKLKSQLSPRLRKKRRPILSRKKLSSVLVLMTS